MTLVVLDAYHLGDPLFIPQLARDVAARKEGLVFVHGSGEAGERALEARGAVPEARDGVWTVHSADEAAEVERATRELNRRLVHEMNEAGVPAVRVMAADRGLVTRTPDGALAAGRTGWLATLVGQGGVAVVAALVAGDGAFLAEADAAATAAALADALEASAVVVLASGRAAGIARDGSVAEEMSLAEASASLADGALAGRLVALARGPVVATSAAQLNRPGPVSGTRLVA